MTRPAQPRPPLLPVVSLGLLAIVVYGACYYAYGVLIQPISADTGWPDAALGAIFSAILLISGAAGVLAGRALDRAGQRPVFVVAAVAGAGAMLAASFQSALLPFAMTFAGGCGLAGALGFYHITQAVAARAAPQAPARAIIWLTLVGALAGPVYLPLTGWLVESAGWRSAIRIEAGTVAAAFLLAATVVNGPNRAPGEAPASSAWAALRIAWRRPRMRAWLLATLIGAAAVDVFIVYQVPMLTRAGLPFEIAATIAGFRGLAQLAGRLPLGKLIRHLGARTTVMLCNIVGALAALLLFAGGTLATALALSFLAGASIGALDALQGIYTHELAGPHDLGTLLGAQRAVFGAGGATGPVAAGALLGATGSYTPTIVIITTGFVAAACVLLLDVGRDRTAGTVPQC